MSRLLNSMASEPSSRLEMPQNVPGTSPIIVETPFRGPESTFSTTWQQTYATSVLQVSTGTSVAPALQPAPRAQFEDDNWTSREGGSRKRKGKGFYCLNW